MKDWQHGRELNDLKVLEAFYEPHNQYALSTFGRFKKNDIAAALHDGTLKHMNEDGSGPGYAYVVEQSKVPSKITMFGKTVIGEKLKGDITFSRLVGNPLDLLELLDPDGQYGAANCWLITYAGNKEIRRIATRSGFDYRGAKYTSMGEVLSVYFRDNPMNFGPRQHPVVHPAELVGMKKLFDISNDLLWHWGPIQEKLQDVQFTSHYSNYNKGKAWSALSLRGYSADESFIAKPIEMNAKWHTEHQHEHFELQDTPLYQKFPEVREVLSFLDGEVHRVRFMKLAPGGGELQRHTDQVDPDAGHSLGALARLHFPLKTNKKVIFSTWNADDVEERYHFAYDECWILDTRKPHMAVNNGDQERIHLVVDTVVTPKLQEMICA